MPTAHLTNAKLAYTTDGDPSGEPLLLVQGLGVQLVGWQQGLVDELVARGFFVIRFDNRDIGRSSRHPVRPLTLLGTVARTKLGWRRRVGYSLREMARDAVELLDHLGVRTAHVAGVSMGSMICQLLAIHYPERVRSVCCMMTTARGGDGRPTSWLTAIRALRLSTANDPARSVDCQVRLMRLVGTPRYFDERAARAYFERAHRRAPDRGGVPRQLAAVIASDNRVRALRSVTAPALVIHGEDDPLIGAVEGWEVAQAIGGADWMLVPGLAHDLPEPLWPTFARAMADNADRATPRLRLVS